MELEIRKRKEGRAALFLLLVLTFAGCRPHTPTAGFPLIIGSRGHTSGKFNHPRGIVEDLKKGLVYVIDRDGRIQKFTDSGIFRASWIMPEVARGKAEDLCLDPAGNVLVADTHYSRIIRFTPDGRILSQFGHYGREPGAFIYPVGICTDPKGQIYVAEYGGNDRIQKFTAQGKLLGSWGKFGEKPGEFQRPSGMVWNQGRIYIADACNHRIQIFSDSGKRLRVIGAYGMKPGFFCYPYDVTVRGDNLYVLEYGNERIQKMNLKTNETTIYGHAGRGNNAFFSPWRFTLSLNGLFVSDTNNNRVVKVSF